VRGRTTDGTQFVDSKFDGKFDGLIT